MISIVIPAYNEAAYINACLESLTRQKTARKFEVIVVNNNSTDDTVNIARSFGKSLRLRILTELNKGRGDARRCGFSAAKGSIILSTDADTVVPENWVETLYRELSSGDKEAVTGTSVITQVHPVSRGLMQIAQLAQMYSYRMIFGHYWLSGFNFGVTKRVYEASGGFSANLNAQEDLDVSFKISRITRTYLIPGCIVTMSGRRFRSGYISGILAYYISFFHYYFSVKKPVLADIR